MPNALNVSDIIRVRVWTRLGTAGQAAVNTFHLFVNSLGTLAATDQDAAEFIDNTIASTVKELMTSAAEYRGVEAQILKPTAPFAARFVPAQTNANAGAGAEDPLPLPHQTTGLITFRTPLAGQANRGRIYLAFPGSTANGTDGSPISAYLTSASNLASFISTPWNITVSGRSASAFQVILHKKNKAGAIPSPTQVTSAAVSTRWATQRRRGEFGRLNLSPI